MEASPRLLLALALAAPGLACAALPCTGWQGTDSSLELHRPNGDVVLRAAPDALAGLRATLLAHCGDPAAARPPLDIGPVEIDADLHPPPEHKASVLEFKLRMRADRLFLKIE